MSRSSACTAHRWRCLGRLALVASAACGTDTIVLATPAADSGMRDAGDTRADGAVLWPDADGDGLCSSNADCRADAFCEKSACAAFFGACTRRPLLCDDAPEPECGCDGITYYNECTRRSEGVVRADDSECSVAPLRCTKGGTPCPNGGYCGILLRNALSCATTSGGACWILPALCVGDSFGGDRFVPCSGADECVDACTAIKRETPHVLERRCERAGN